MGAKRKKRRTKQESTGPGSGPRVSEYVEKRVDELSEEHGWDAEAVKGIVAGKPKRSRS